MEPHEHHQASIEDAIRSIYDVGEACWNEITPLLSWKRIEKKEHFSQEGEYRKEIAFVLEGVLRIYYVNEKGEEWTKHFLLENDFLAASIDPDRKSIVNIQALMKVETLSIPFLHLRGLSNKYPQIDKLIQRIVFQYLVQKQEKEKLLLSKDAAANYRAFQKEFPGLENRIADHHISSYLGVTPTQLSRIKKKM